MLPTRLLRSHQGNSSIITKLRISPKHLCSCPKAIGRATALPFSADCIIAAKSKTAADDQRFRFYRIVYDFSATRNGGNAWDEGATVLTVQDATEAAQFQVGDLVWISSPNYKPDGEIVVPQEIAMEALVKAEDIETREQGMREDLAAGVSFREAFEKWGRA